MQSNPLEHFTGRNEDKVGPERYSTHVAIKPSGYSFGKSNTIRNPFKLTAPTADVGPGQYFQLLP